MIKQCEFCGKHFTKGKNISRKKWSERRFCSMSCFGKFKIGKKHSEEHNRKIRESCKGLVNSGQFKKKMPVGQKCYFCDKLATYTKPKPSCNTHWKRHFYKYKRTTINGKNTMVHRAVMEEFIGRKLKTDEIVHHINSDRLDNRIENLELMKKIDHLKMHANLRKVI